MKPSFIAILKMQKRERLEVLSLVGCVNIQLIKTLKWTLFIPIFEKRNDEKQINLKRREKIKNEREKRRKRKRE